MKFDTFDRKTGQWVLGSKRGWLQKGRRELLVILQFCILIMVWLRICWTLTGWILLNVKSYFNKHDFSPPWHFNGVSSEIYGKMVWGHYLHELPSWKSKNTSKSLLGHKSQKWLIHTIPEEQDQTAVVYWHAHQCCKFPFWIATTLMYPLHSSILNLTCDVSIVVGMR